MISIFLIFLSYLFLELKKFKNNYLKNFNLNSIIKFCFNIKMIILKITLF